MQSIHFLCNKNRYINLKKVFYTLKIQFTFMNFHNEIKPPNTPMYYVAYPKFVIQFLTCGIFFKFKKLFR